MTAHTCASARADQPPKCRYPLINLSRSNNKWESVEVRLLCCSVLLKYPPACVRACVESVSVSVSVM